MLQGYISTARRLAVAVIERFSFTCVKWKLGYSAAFNELPSSLQFRNFCRSNVSRKYRFTSLGLAANIFYTWFRNIILAVEIWSNETFGMQLWRTGKILFFRNFQICAIYNSLHIPIHIFEISFGLKIPIQKILKTQFWPPPIFTRNLKCFIIALNQIHPFCAYLQAQGSVACWHMCHAVKRPSWTFTSIFTMQWMEIRK